VIRVQVIRRRYELPLRSNSWLVVAIAITIGLQLLVLYSPANHYFGVSPLAVTAWTWIAAAFVAFLLLNLGVDTVLDRTFPDTRVMQ
jgi:Ca2+-transporting ATPase